jgi:hypothetical protein
MPTLNVPLHLPQTTSPVPTLASVHVEEGRGDFGDPNYRGNCSGLLIRDLLRYFQPRNLLDAMQGGGTAGDVAQALGIPYQGFDLKTGFDAADPRSFDGLGGFDMVWLHPPYHDMIRYSSDARCLSRCDSPEAFFVKLTDVLRNCMNVLTERGHLAILMGDITRRGAYFALPFHTWRIARDLGLELACPEIVRLSHGATSTGRSYRFSFIPRVHDVCLVLRRRTRSGN